jgi:hypothetical protein
MYSKKYGNKGERRQLHERKASKYDFAYNLQWVIYIYKQSYNGKKIKVTMVTWNSVFV